MPQSCSLLHGNIIEIYKGKPIRHVNAVTLKLGAAPYKAIIDAVEDTGLSVHQVLGHSSKPCEKCKGIFIAVYDDSGNPRYIKKGLLTIPNKNGGSNLLTHRRTRVIKDTATGETYTSISIVSRKFHINYSTLSAKLRGIRINDTQFTYAEITTADSKNV